MQITDFKLERYFAAYEFKVRYLLSASDCEALTLAELLAMADPATLDLWRDLSLGYTESQGHPLLREEVARLYSGIAPDETLIAAPEELIFIAMNVLLAPGDHVIATFPGYQSLYEVAGALGAAVTRWALTPSASGWQLDLAALERSITPRTRLLVINFPHNPTGHLPTAAELDAIIALARRHNLHIFSDEMYRLLEYDPAERLPSVADLYERGIALSGLSKSFALPGLRIGWLASHDRDFLARARRVQGLHHHLQQRAERSARHHGVAQPRAHRRAQPGDHPSQPGAGRAVFRRAQRRVPLAAAAGGLSRLPAAYRGDARR